MTAAWLWIGAIPDKIKLYTGVAIVIVIALLRWRQVGINSAIEKLEKRDHERAQKIKERVAVARSRYPDGDVDIVARLREYGHLRDE